MLHTSIYKLLEKKYATFKNLDKRFLNNKMQQIHNYRSTIYTASHSQTTWFYCTHAHSQRRLSPPYFIFALSLTASWLFDFPFILFSLLWFNPLQIFSLLCPISLKLSSSWFFKDGNLLQSNLKKENAPLIFHFLSSQWPTLYTWWLLGLESPVWTWASSLLLSWHTELWKNSCHSFPCLIFILYSLKLCSGLATYIGRSCRSPSNTQT